jgi:hypothetical protein
MMRELTYTYTQEEKYLVGRLDDYPEYPTQGTDINDLEAAFLEIYNWIQDGTLAVRERRGILKVA